MIPAPRFPGDREPAADTCTTARRPREPFGPGHDRPLTAAYTRADAVADGLLIETPRELTEQHRIPGPLAVTAQLWADAIATASYPDALPAYVWPQVWPFEVRERLTHLLRLARTAYETDQLRSHRQVFVAWRIPARHADASTPADVRDSDDHSDARPIRVALTLSAGDHGETVATLAHATAAEVGRFRLDGDESGATWSAAGYEQDSPAGDVCPLVTVATLAALIDSAAADVTRPPEVEAYWWRNGQVTVSTNGSDVILSPDPVAGPGMYRLGALGWPLRRVGDTR